MIDELARPQLRWLKPYVPGKPIEEVKREYGLTEVIKLASNENPLGPSPKAVRAMQDEVGKVNLYPEPLGPQLRADIATRLGIEPQNILLGNGGEGLLTIIAQSFVCPEDEAIIAQTTFSIYEQNVRLFDGRPVIVPMTADIRHSVKEIERAITPKTKLVYICNPNNPTGTIVYRKEVEWFMERVPDHVIVVFDEAYYDFVEHPDYPQSVEYLKKGRNVIILRTFSKVYGLAGTRIGYLLSTPEIITCMTKVRETFPVNRVAQAGARAALQDEEFRQQTLAVNSAGKRFLSKQFAEMGFEYLPTEGNFVFVNFGIDSREMFQRLVRRGVIIRPGNIWNYQTWARVSIGLPAQNEAFIAACKEALKE